MIRLPHFLLLALAVALVSCDSGGGVGSTEATAIDAPTPIAPMDGAQDVTTSLDIAWMPSIGAETYRIQLALSPSFASPLLDESGLFETAFELNGLGLQTPYFWRVCAEAPDAVSEWSRTWSFVPTADIQIPPVAAQVYPEDQAENLPNEITFRWDRVPQASSYDLQVALEPTFIRKDADMTRIHQTQQRISMLTPGYDYYWRVRSRNPLGISEWSPTRKLVVVI